MSNIPSQTRSIDAFSSYYSNITNRLTRIVSRGEDVLLTKDSLQLSFDDSSDLDTTSVHTIVISPGYIIKDDVLIHFDESFDVDMSDSEFYRSGTTPFDETGIYYITVAYVYQKTKPPPEAKIIILKPSEQDRIDESYYFFIGAVDVLDDGNENLYIDEVYEYDPDSSDILRNYPKSIARFVSTLPSYDAKEDEGNIIYDLETEELYWGSFDRWVKMSTADTIIIHPDDDDYDYISNKLNGSIEIVNNDGVYNIQLENDSNNPGNNKFYATDTNGTKGWYSSEELEEATSQELSIAYSIIFGS